MANQNLLVVGKINGPWGIKGFVKFTPNVNEPGLFEKNNTFYLDDQQTKLIDIVTQNKKKYLRFASIENRNEVEILAIGIGHDVSRYYQKAIKISDVQELGDVMIEQLSGLFENKKKLH